MTAEKKLQSKYGSAKRAAKFEKTQKHDFINPMMIEFIAKQEILFIATSDKEGNCDNSIRTGPKGFIKIIDSKNLIYPEYRGNGMYASLGNIIENPHIGLLLVDFFEATIGLHINGEAEIIESTDQFEDSLAERWVKVHVEEAYIHCSKHIPLLKKLDKKIHWNTDDTKHKGGNYFDANN
jgi:predicted pyridoxine 5'-phosphate oxidase superfamily flavin-nucleotide-binding protein